MWSRSKEGGRDVHVVRERGGREGGGKGWLCLAVKARVPGRGSSPSFEEYGSKEAGSISSSRILISRTERGGGGRGGREGGGSASHKSADVRGKEGEKKRGKRKRNERERGRGSFTASYPVFCLDQEEI